MKNNFLLKSILFLIVFIIFKIILNLFSLEFMNWVYYFSFFCFLSMWTLGWFQYLSDIKKNGLRNALYVLLIILTGIVLFIAYFIHLWIDVDVKIIKNEDNKVVKETRMVWDLPIDSYYKYYNFFIKSKNSIY